MSKQRPHRGESDLSRPLRTPGRGRGPREFLSSSGREIPRSSSGAVDLTFSSQDEQPSSRQARHGLTTSEPWRGQVNIQSRERGPKRERGQKPWRKGSQVTLFDHLLVASRSSRTSLSLEDGATREDPLVEQKSAEVGQLLAIGKGEGKGLGREGVGKIGGSRGSWGRPGGFLASPGWGGEDAAKPSKRRPGEGKSQKGRGRGAGPVFVRPEPTGRKEDTPKPGKRRLGPTKKRLSVLKKRILLDRAERWRQLRAQVPPGQDAQPDGGEAVKRPEAEDEGQIKQASRPLDAATGVHVGDPCARHGDEGHDETQGSPSGREEATTWRVVILHLVSEEDVEDDEEHAEIVNDIAGMVARFDCAAAAVKVPRPGENGMGTAVVDFESRVDAETVARGLQGLVVGGALLETRVVSGPGCSQGNDSGGPDVGFGGGDYNPNNGGNSTALTAVDPGGSCGGSGGPSGSSNDR
ncbi:unnamed protein product, partial [Discosporangium mesarthrocarpum]